MYTVTAEVEYGLDLLSIVVSIFFNKRNNDKTSNKLGQTMACCKRCNLAVTLKCVNMTKTYLRLRPAF